MRVCLISVTNIGVGFVRGSATVINVACLPAFTASLAGHDSSLVKNRKIFITQSKHIFIKIGFESLCFLLFLLKYLTLILGVANTGSLFRTRGAQKYQCFEVLASFLQRYCITALTISIPDCVYFPSYSAKCFSCFMLRRLMMPIYLVKILNI